MRITPVRAYGPNLMTKNAQKNVSFGMYDSRKTEDLMPGILDMDDEDTGDLDRAVFEFYKTTPFVIVKSTKDNKGKDIIYAVLNKEETDKHPYKSRFDGILEILAERKKRLQKQTNEVEESKNPNYIMIFRDFRDADILREEILEAEVNYVPEPTSHAPRYEYKEDPLWEVLDKYKQ